MELSKQEMELFFPLPGLISKNFFYTMFFIFTKGSKLILNKKWNFPNRKCNFSSHLQALDKKLALQNVATLSSILDSQLS